MESGKIQDSQLTASSIWGNIFTPGSARLNDPYRFWAAQENNVGEWLQIDFKQKMAVTKVATQGKPDEHQQWVTSYKVKFSKDPVQWEAFKESGKEKVRSQFLVTCTLNFTFLINPLTIQLKIQILQTTQ